LASDERSRRVDLPFAITTSETDFRMARASASESGSFFEMRSSRTETFRASSTARVRSQLTQPGRR
jgi:hypothetical protein